MIKLMILVVLFVLSVAVVSFEILAEIGDDMIEGLDL